MEHPAFDTEALFDQDYLYFYAPVLTAEHSDAQTEQIWRLLQLRPGMRVLDLACGHGRIANRLAARGCQVTGLDVTPLFLEVARRDADQLGVEVDYVQGDMRELPWTKEFDRVINWFTAFGYFDDGDNRRVLDQIAQALKPGGAVALDLLNPYWLAQNFKPHRVAAERDGNYLIDKSWLDFVAGTVNTERTVLCRGEVRRFEFFVRLFTYTELRDWLVVAGFTGVDCYGGDGEPLSLESWRMVVTAQR